MCVATDKRGSSPNNNDLIANAGKVPLDAGKPWGRGMWSDVRNTLLPHWVKGMTNFNQKTVAVTLLLFISVVAPTLTFGAVYGRVTGNLLGAVEAILATAWVNIAYSLFGGMPLCVIGSTGPVLALSTALFRMSENIGVPFLTMYAWTSIWLLGYCFFAAFFDLTRFVRLATRFTDEIFALLIVSIFVMDAIGDPFSNVGLLRYLDPNHPTHEKFEDDPDYNYLTTALLSIILGLGTTWFIFALRGFRHSAFCCNDGVRTSINDFSVTLSVITFTVIKQLGFSSVETEELNVPSQFEPSYACCDETCTTFFPDECPEGQTEAWGTRNWFADLGDLNGKNWVIIAAAGPGFLAFLLCFLDNGITWHLINHKSHNLKNGEAYNWDLVCSGIFNCINGLLGLPWLVATTVPCIIHLNGLATKDQDGKFIEVQETRLTLLFSHLLLGLSLLFLDALKVLPVPVLYGVFLFMGLSALPAMQFWNRLMLFFQQPSRHAKTVYNDHMEKKNVHKYTIFQLCFFCGIFVVMNIPAISIIFPFMTLLCIPSRLFFLPKFFQGWELLLLDGEDENIGEWIEAKRTGEANIMMLEDGDDNKSGSEIEKTEIDIGSLRSDVKNIDSEDV